jgi:ABC-type multidrug transport system fused ATPase/permease subunit
MSSPCANGCATATSNQKPTKSPINARNETFPPRDTFSPRWGEGFRPALVIPTLSQGQHAPEQSQAECWRSRERGPARLEVASAAHPVTAVVGGRVVETKLQIGQEVRAGEILIVLDADAGSVLLLAYWALNLPVLGEEIAMMVRQYPHFRNLTLRLLEPLGGPEESRIADCGLRLDDKEAAGSQQNADVVLLESAISNPQSAIVKGVCVSLDAVTVRASGHMILEDLDFNIAAGSHVAVVGVSGAGKSSLLGLLLGWHRVASGCVCVDGEPLDAARLDRLRNETAWVDPAVQLCNASLINNLLYGTSPDAAPALGAVVEGAGLTDVLQRLPEGLQTPLGEGRGRQSGGQGQRVRLGRALVRSDARLVLLDEPFRGLDREQRRALLRRARQVWREATLLCVTHDIGETRDFERVLVIEAGRVVEDGCPAALAEAPSRYRALLDAEQALQSELWSGENWRRMRLEEGRLSEAIPTTTTSTGAVDYIRRNGESNGAHLVKSRGLGV